MANLVLNGDFSARGYKWDSKTTNFDGNTANVTNIGHIEQIITLDAPLKKGDTVQIKFKVTAMYGSAVTVSVHGVSYPDISKEGEHEIAITLTSDMSTNELKLKFQASNAFTLDNVWLELENKACTPKDVIQHGDFSSPAEAAKYWTDKDTSFFNGKANVANIGHIQQKVTLDRPLVKGDIVKLKFTISDLYGDVTVSLHGISYPSFKTAGTKEIALVIPADHPTNETTLKFQATNAFGLDDVEMKVCL